MLTVLSFGVSGRFANCHNRKLMWDTKQDRKNSSPRQESVTQKLWNVRDSELRP